MIKVENLNVSYGKKEVLKNVNITIDEQDFVIITGKSGCGKTTLINCLSMLEKYDSGVISYFGESYNQMSNRKKINILKRDFALIFQDFGLIEELSVYKNLSFVSQNKTRIREKLKDFNLDINLETKVSLLSGGEKQRLALARAVLKSSKVIFADEPTGNLDDKNSQIVMEFLTEMNKEGKTVVVVTHDLKMLDYANKVYEM
ncbi:MAG: ABC transporter ATP-binding protein [Bacilli bacterium]